jgi:GT2 family glycosyltransferase
LLNALEEQTLPRERFEVCVAHDSRDEETEELLRSHPLAADGTLRHVQLEPIKEGSAGLKRNLAWRMARAPLIAFTDDDCYPPPNWLERALEAARRNPGAVVQGCTYPDPEEVESEGRGPWAHFVYIGRPPTPWGETCNIVYPRALLDQLGGFVEDPPLRVVEDTDLAIRARASGAPHVGAREVVTHHAVEAMSLYRQVGAQKRWRDNPWVVKTHPEFRAAFPLWIFWTRGHAWLPFAALGLVLQRRNPLYALLALPFIVHAMPRRGSDPRGRLRAILELPGATAIEVAEFLAMVRGSVKHRTLFV